MKVRYFDFAWFLYAYREIFVRRVYQMRGVPAAARIFDCGANIGLATLFFKAQWPACTVWCFEPDPQTFGVLRSNVEDNGLLGVQSFNIALWDSEGEIEFSVPGGVPGSLQMSVFPDRNGGNRQVIRVPARALSSYIGDKRVDLLKLDVEGAEMNVMGELSASGKLSLIDAIVAEYHHRIGGKKSQLSEFLAILEQAGFEYQIHAGWRPALGERAAQDVLIYAARSANARQSGERS